MPAPYHAWTRETIAAVKAADRSYVFAWNRVMRAFDQARTLTEARDAYNKAMAPVYAKWQADSRAAVALSEPPPEPELPEGDPF